MCFTTMPLVHFHGVLRDVICMQNPEDLSTQDNATSEASSWAEFIFNDK
jgi:hypothetical protein